MQEAAMVFNIQTRKLRQRSRARAKADVLSRLDALLQRRISTARPSFAH
jgi:hypothetical protein